MDADIFASYLLHGLFATPLVAAVAVAVAALLESRRPAHPSPHRFASSPLPGSSERASTHPGGRIDAVVDEIRQNPARLRAQRPCPPPAEVAQDTLARADSEMEGASA